MWLENFVAKLKINAGNVFDVSMKSIAMRWWSIFIYNRFFRSLEIVEFNVMNNFFFFNFDLGVDYCFLDGSLEEKKISDLVILEIKFFV